MRTTIRCCRRRFGLFSCPSSFHDNKCHFFLFCPSFLFLLLLLCLLSATQIFASTSTAEEGEQQQEGAVRWHLHAADNNNNVNDGHHHHQQQLPICRVCNCNRRMRSVECLPISSANNGRQQQQQQQFRLKMVRLSPWADTFFGLNLSQPEFPHFASHSGLRQLRLLHSQLRWLHPLSFAPLPGLEVLQLSDNNIEWLPHGLFQPLGRLRMLDLAGNRLALDADDDGNSALSMPMPVVGTQQSNGNGAGSNDGTGNEQQQQRPQPQQQQHVLDRLILDRNPLCQNGQATSAATIAKVPKNMPKATTTTTKWTLPLARQLQLKDTGMVAINSTHFTFQAKVNNFSSSSSSSPAICHLPFGPANWHALEELHVSENPQLHVHTDALPLLANVRFLDLAGASLVPTAFFRELAKQNGTAKLRHLDLHGVGGIRNFPQTETAVASAIGGANDDDDGEKQLANFFPFDIDDAGNDGDNDDHKVDAAQSWWSSESKSICLPSMQWLDVSNLHLDGQLWLSGCCELKWLYVDENRLSELHFGDQTGPEALLALSMRSNRLRHFPPALLAASHSLVSLQLANNGIGHLAGNGRLLLEQFPHLQQLDLAGNRLRHFQLQPATALPPPVSLNNNGNRSIYFTTPFPPLNASSIKGNANNLLLSHSNQQQQQQLHLAMPMPSSSSSQLVFLNLSNNRLRSFHIVGGDAEQHFAYSSTAAVPLLQSLTALDLSGNLLAEFSSLAQLPSLEHLHLARNPGIQLKIPSQLPNTALVHLDLANCSLHHLPDLSQLVALRELNVRGNRLHTVPAQLLPREGLASLDLRVNLVQRVGWEWSADQLASLTELRAEANPLDCQCPMPAQLARRVGFQHHPSHFCTGHEDNLLDGSLAATGKWTHKHPLDSFLLPGDALAEQSMLLSIQSTNNNNNRLIASRSSSPSSNCPYSSAGAANNDNGINNAAASSSLRSRLIIAGAAAASSPLDSTTSIPSVFALFLLPLLLIGTSVTIALLLLNNGTNSSNGGNKWQEQFYWARSELGGGNGRPSTMLAYEQLPVEQMADSV